VKTKARAWSGLSEKREVGANHRGNFGIPAGDWPVRTEQNGKAIARHLNGTWRGAFGRNVR
jgi:hypothetical protein